MGIGAAFGMSWVALKTTANERLRYMNASIGSLVGAMLGGRVAYIVVNWNYFRQHLLEIFQIYQGGLAWSGALAGGLVMIVIYARHLKKTPGEVLWSLFPLLVSMIIFSWLACWWDGCAYGSLDYEILGLPALDELGNRSSRLPTQFFGALVMILGFVALDMQRSQFKRMDILGWIGLFGTTLILFGMTFLRADPGIYWNGLRLDAWAALGFALIALVGMAASWR